MQHPTMTRLILRAALCGLALTCFTAEPAAQRNGVRLAPVDEGSKDPSFATYRSDLLRAVKARNLERVLSMVSPSIKTHEASATGGLTILRRDWKLPQNSTEFFSALQQVLENGGRFQAGDAFIAPYWHLDFPGEFSDLGIFRYIFVPVRDAPILGSPNKSAPRIGTASHQMFKYIPGEREYFQVTLFDGRAGFIDKRFV